MLRVIALIFTLLGSMLVWDDVKMGLVYLFIAGVVAGIEYVSNFSLDSET